MSSTLPIWNANTEAAEVSEALRSYIHGKNILITGCTIGGLGFEVAKLIAEHANLVVIAGSNRERLEASSSSIKSSFPQANVRILIINLASLQSVRDATTEVNAYPEPIHVLINNAAAKIGPYLTTEEGFESQFGIDHLAHFLFTSLLFPKLLSSQSSSESFLPRIITVASEGHKEFDDGGPGIRFDDLDFGKGERYHNYRAYAQAKTANLLFNGELARRIRARGLGVGCFAVQPGAIWTNSAANTTNEDYIAMGAMTPDGKLTDMFNWKTMGQGAAKYIVAAFDPRLDHQSGGYVWNDCQIHNEQVASYASDPVIAEKLWTLSEELVGQTFTI